MRKRLITLAASTCAALICWGSVGSATPHAAGNDWEVAPRSSQAMSGNDWELTTPAAHGNDWELSAQSRGNDWE